MSLLDKETVKFTRRGMESRNMATGETQLKTLSKFGKELKYEKSSIPKIGGSRSVDALAPAPLWKNAAAHSAQPTRPASETDAKTGTVSGSAGEDAVPSAIPETPIGRSVQNKLGSIHSFAGEGRFGGTAAWESVPPAKVNRRKTEDPPEDDFPASAIHAAARGKSAWRFTAGAAKRTSRAIQAIRNRQVNQRLRNSRSAVKVRSHSQKYAESLSAFARKTTLSAANAAFGEMEKSDETGFQTIGSAYSGARKSVDAARTVGHVGRRVGRKLGGTRIGRRVGAFAARTRAAAANAVKRAVQQTAASAAKLLVNPVVLKGVLLAGGGLLLLNLLISSLGGLFGGMAGSVNAENADPSLVEYIQSLDTAFLEEQQEKAMDFQSYPYDQIMLVGTNRVDTSVNDMLALLCVGNDFDTTLNGDTMRILQEYHAVLNVCTLDEMAGTVTDMDGNEKDGVIGIFTIETYTARQRIESFGFDEEQKETLLALFELSSEITGNGMFLWPLRNYHYVSSEYGERIDPVTHEMVEFHTALDISAPEETPILAAGKGTVIWAAPLGTYGNLIKLKHSDGLETWYAHCSAFALSVGDTVSPGDVIAYVGMTGRTTGPHLHFEVRLNGRHQNPRDFLK